VTRYRVIDARRTVDARRFPAVYAARPYALQRLEPSRYGRGTWVVLNLYPTREKAHAAKERLRQRSRPIAPAE
jgi:hypothetical protein